jgi:hypothetical protein
MHCASAAFAAGAIKRGFDLIMLTSDVACLTAGARRQLDDLKTATAWTTPGATAAPVGRPAASDRPPLGGFLAGLPGGARRPLDALKAAIA